MRIILGEQSKIVEDIFFFTGLVCWGQSFVGTFEGKAICENSIGMSLLRNDNDCPFHLS